MSVTSGPINEAEQAAEKATDHAVPLVIQIVDAIFQRIWRTRIVIDLQERQ